MSSVTHWKCFDYAIWGKIFKFVDQYESFLFYSTFATKNTKEPFGHKVNYLRGNKEGINRGKRNQFTRHSVTTGT